MDRVLCWIVIFDQSLSEVLVVPLGIRNQFLLLLSLIIVFVGLMAFSLSEKITAPLKNLTKKISKIGVNQEPDTEIIIRTGDEIEKLSLSFSQMLGRLNTKTKELEKRKEKLEQSYQEIKKRKEELEKFYSLTIGRELRMIELKKEIKKLGRTKNNKQL